MSFFCIVVFHQVYLRYANEIRFGFCIYLIRSGHDSRTIKSLALFEKRFILTKLRWVLILVLRCPFMNRMIFLIFVIFDRFFKFDRLLLFV